MKYVNCAAVSQLFQSFSGSNEHLVATGIFLLECMTSSETSTVLSCLCQVN